MLWSNVFKKKNTLIKYTVKKIFKQTWNFKETSLSWFLGSLNFWFFTGLQKKLSKLDILRKLALADF